MKIKLTKGFTAEVDPADYARVSRFKWCAHVAPNCVYAVRNSRGPKHRLILMHRFIVRARKGQKTDHKDGNGLNNRRSNLRTCTQSQNGCNRGKPRHNTSGHKGVSWQAQNKNWRAYIVVNRRQIHLGCFDKLEDAAKAARSGTRKYHRGFAHL